MLTHKRLTRTVRHIPGSLKQRSGQVAYKPYGKNLLIVCWAPLSTNAFTLNPLTSTGILMAAHESIFHPRQHAQHSLKHSNPPEKLGRILHRMLHILQNSLLANILLNPALRLYIKRVRVERGDFALRSELRLVLSFAVVPEQFSESLRIILYRICHFGLRLLGDGEWRVSDRGEGQMAG